MVNITQQPPVNKSYHSTGCKYSIICREAQYTCTKGGWNNYFLPALLLDKAEMKTVPIMIAQLRAADYSKFDLGKVYMFILLAILPVLLVYIFLSRYIVKGVTAGSVKG